MLLTHVMLLRYTVALGASPITFLMLRLQETCKHAFKLLYLDCAPAHFAFANAVAHAWPVLKILCRVVQSHEVQWH